jgi:hypothetical protein
MILDMLRRGADVDTISTITGATVEEINKIAMTAKNQFLQTNLILQKNSYLEIKLILK